jgi:hypothetical protein
MTTKLTLQSEIIRLLSQDNIDRRLGRGRLYFPDEVQKQFSQENKPSKDQINQTLWALLGKGLVYIDISQPSADNWEWCLTDTGKISASDEQFNPDDPERYLERLKKNVPEINPLVYQYADEAVNCYNHDCYLASAVMLGAASEAAFLEMAYGSIPWFDELGDSLKTILDNPRQPYIKKFQEFRKKIDIKKSKLPKDLEEKLHLTFDSLLDLYRVTRNDVGHPTGKMIERDDQYISLQMFGRYLQTVYRMKSSFSDSQLTNHLDK